MEKKREISKVNMLTPMQEGMLFHSLSDGEGENYYQQMCFYIEGALDLERLQQAWEEIVNRYDVFKTLFRWKELNKPVQIVLKEQEANIVQYDISNLIAVQQERFIADFKKSDLAHKFDFEEGKLNRLTICKLAESKYFACWTFHHILLDGWSMPVVMGNFLNIYYCLKNGLPCPPKPLSQFSDYLEWLKKRNTNEANHFWKSYVQEISEPTFLPGVKAVERGQVLNRAKQICVEFTPSETGQINEFCRAHNITSNALIQTAWGILLQKYHNTDLSCFGMTVSGRPVELRHVDEIVGIFINTLPVVVKRGETESILDLLLKINTDLVEIREYEYMHLAEIQKMSQLRPGMELFDSIVVFENYPIESAIEEMNPGFKIVFDSMFELTNYTLTIAVTSSTTMRIDFLYKVDVLPDEVITRIRANLSNLILTMIAEPKRLVKEVSILSSAEKELLLNVFNNTTKAYPVRTLPQLFEEQAGRFPDQTAVIFADSVLTYGELNARANQLARTLQARGVKPEQIVGLMLQRSLEMAVGILAVMKAGGAYVPIDPEYPEERIRFILKDSAVQLIISNLSLNFETVQVINPADAAISQQDPVNLAFGPSPDSLAYVIYTSGSTGQPKGVLVEHQSIANSICWRRDEYQFGSADRILQMFSYAFDGFLTSFFTPLVSGAVVVFLHDEDVKNPVVIKKLINIHQITHFICVPSLYSAILECLTPEDLTSLRIITLAGEKVTDRIVELSKLKKADLELVNEYGPTENSVVTTCLRGVEPGAISIGRPAANTRVYIFDKNDNLLPIGGIGELCISGKGLARGYLNRPEMTVEKFTINPVTGEKMYRTGDLARWCGDGCIEFLGRIDHQVKIRGYRIETGEIEKKLLQHPLIKETIVIDRDDANSSKYLCAYIVAAEELANTAIRAFLAEELPEYMIPATFVQLEKMPLTLNGKINRDSLPEPTKASSNEQAFVAPHNEDEEKLAEIWSKVLRVEKVGVTDNFFELGGDSIKAIQVIARADSCGINVTVKDIFKYKTIAQILENVNYQANKIQAVQEEVTGEVPLNPIQGWFFEQDFHYQDYWNQTNLFALPDNTNVNVLEEALRKIIAHHDALRMVYRLEAGQVIQYNRGIDESSFQLEQIDLSAEPEQAQKAKLKELSEQIQSSLNLEGELFKAVIFDLGARGKRLLLTFHHLIIDGVSWRILLEDLENLYQSNLQAALPLKTTSFKDYSHKLLAYAKDSDIDTGYWENLNLDKVKSYKTPDCTDNLLGDFARLSMELDREATRKLLTDANLAYNTGIHELLLAALVQTFGEVIESDGILLTLESHGREGFIEDWDLTRTIGWFTAAYPVYLEKKESIKKLIIHVKESLRRVPNKGLNFGLARYLLGNSEMRKINPELSFNYLGQFDQTQSASGEVGFLAGCEEEVGLSVHPGNQNAQTVLDVSGLILNEILQISFDYNQKCFSSEKMESFKAAFQQNLQLITAHCLQSEKTYTAADFDLQNILDEEEFELLLDRPDLIAAYELTPMQNGMLYYNLLNEKGANYYEQTCFLIEGRVDIAYLRQAWQEVISRHSIFRTDFRWKKLKNPVQVVFREKAAEITEYDITPLSAAEQDAFIQRFKQEDLERKFDFENGKLNRFALIKLTEDRFFVCWTFHHILLDGWSGQIVLDEFFRIYLALITGERLPQYPKAQFSDYLEWLKKKDKKAGLAYWKGQFKDFENPTRLGTTRKYTTEIIKKSDTLELELDQEKTRIINNFCKANNITINAFVQTAWGILLQKYNNTDKSCFGMTVSGRSAEIREVEAIVGLLINTIPVLIKTANSDTVQTLLAKVNNEIVNAREYEYISLAEIQKSSNLDSEEGLFDSIVVFENFPLSSVLEKLKLDFEIVFDSSHELTNYDLTIAVFNGETLNFKFGYNPEVYAPDFLIRLSDNLHHLLERMVTMKEQLVKQIPILSEREKQLLLSGFNQPLTVNWYEKTIYQLFEEQVVKSPEKVAISFAEQELTYTVLNEQANRLARILQKKGVSAGRIVAVLTGHSLELAVGILAILKSGAAYVPIDPAYPKERIEYILQDSGASIIVSKKGESAACQAEIFELDLTGENLIGEETANLTGQNQPEDLAYIIYTSGSTGQPKGVMIEHRNIANSIFWRREAYQLTVEDRVLQLFSMAFDGFLTSFFTPLVSGAQVILLNGEEAKDPGRIKKTIAAKGITHFICIPSLFGAIMEFLTKEEANSLRMITLAGEALKPQLVSQCHILNPAIELINEYGPTENSVVTTIARHLQADQPITIGKPIANTQVYIVDESLSLVPIGVPGELVISGHGLARGYLNKHELTQEKFMPNPYGPGRLYRTGDLARWLPDGNIEFLGRLDYQVKIRGYRIETGEIERCLTGHAQVKEAVVIDREDAEGSKYLCAYLILNGDLPDEDLRYYLQSLLPTYMIPGYFIRLKSIPVTPNGKVDRKALPGPDDSLSPQRKYTPPTNEVEAKLAKIWAKALGVKQVGIHDNFFTLGGHSLKATSVVSGIYRDFNVILSLMDIFKYPTVSKLAKAITMVQDFKKSVTLLNGEYSDKIFCFPPGAGNGVVYKEMADLIDSHAVYSFDFIETSDRITQYTRLVQEIQKEGPYVFLGYSGGGNIAFEVAKEMEAEGQEVAAIILIDSYKREQVVERSREEVDSVINLAFASAMQDEVLKDYLSVESIRMGVADRIRSSMLYLDCLINTGQISASLYLIKAADAQAGSDRNNWYSATTGKVHELQGAGTHDEMLNPKFLSENAEIVQTLLKKLALKRRSQPKVVEK